MKISILVPIYKTEQYIRRCAVSILSQDYNDLEIIFVDDCSPDNSVSILNEVLALYPNRKSQIKIIRNSTNLGLARTRNIALSHSSGDYIYIIDSDDYILESTVITQFVSYALKYTADIVEGDYIKGYADVEIPVINNRNTSTKKRILKDIIQKKTNITIWNKLIKRQLYTDNNILVPDGINNGEDYVTLVRLAYYANKIVHLNIFSYYYNLNNQTAFSANKSKDDNLANMLVSNRYIYSFVIENIPSLARYVEAMFLETKAYIILYSSNSRKLLKNNDFKYQYIRLIRPLYAFVLILDILHLDKCAFLIGKIFRNNASKN